MTKVTPNPCPSNTPYVVAIIVLVLLAIGLAVWAAYSFWSKKPTCPPAPTPVPGPQSSPVPGPQSSPVPGPQSSPVPGPQTAFLIYGNPTGAKAAEPGPNNALIQSGGSLLLGPSTNPAARWRVVGTGSNQVLQNASTGMYLAVAPNGTVSFNPNQASATPVSLKLTGPTVIGTPGLSEGIGGLTALPDGRVVAQAAGSQPDPKMVWLIVTAPQ